MLLLAEIVEGRGAPVRASILPHASAGGHCPPSATNTPEYRPSGAHACRRKSSIEIGLCRPSPSPRGRRACPSTPTRTSSPYFLAEERLRTEATGVVGRPMIRVSHRRVLADEIVSPRARCADNSLGRQCLGMAEVEAQPVRRVERAALCDVIAERAAQATSCSRWRGPEWGVARIVVATAAWSSGPVCRPPAPGFHFALDHLGPCGRKTPADLLFVSETSRRGQVRGADACRCRPPAPPIPRRTASGFHQRSRPSRPVLGPRRSPPRRAPAPATALRPVRCHTPRNSVEAMRLCEIEPDRGIRLFARTRTMPARALAFWASIAVSKPSGIDRAALFRAAASCVRSSGKAVGIVELERRLAGQGRRPLGQALQFLVEQLEPAVQRGAEALFLQLQRFGDQRLRGGPNSGVCLPPSGSPARAPAGASTDPARPEDAHAASRGA